MTEQEMKVEDAMLLYCFLHEYCHFVMCRLFRVEVQKFHLNGSRDTRLIVRDPGRVKLFLIRLAPYFLELPYGLRLFNVPELDSFRVVWLKSWFRVNLRRWAPAVVAELRKD